MKTSNALLMAAASAALGLVAMNAANAGPAAVPKYESE
jgi:hypothetical protein